MLNSTHIVLRIPGFLASVERRYQGVPASVPLLVCTGEGSRSLILSACELAIRQGARPGLRIGQLRGYRGEIVDAKPYRYRSESMRLGTVLGEHIPDPAMVRAGVFHSIWSRGRRFLDSALGNAKVDLLLEGYSGAWGIGPGDAVAEIAATVAPLGEQVEVQDFGTSTFLAPQPLHLLPELSTSQVRALADIGVRNFGQLARLPDEVLRSLLGQEGPALKRLAIHGTRGPAPKQWRDRRRLGEDTADIAQIQQAVAELVADGVVHVLVAMGRIPRAVYLTLCYTDGRQAGTRITSTRPEHEGSWQRLAQEAVMILWTRRVRVAEIRLSVGWGGQPSDQLSLFVPAQRQFRDRELAHAVTHVRARWGQNLVRYAV